MRTRVMPKCLGTTNIKRGFEDTDGIFVLEKFRRNPAGRFLIPHVWVLHNQTHHSFHNMGFLQGLYESMVGSRLGSTPNSVLNVPLLPRKSESLTTMYVFCYRFAVVV